MGALVVDILSADRIDWTYTKEKTVTTAYYTDIAVQRYTVDIVHDMTPGPYDWEQNSLVTFGQNDIITDDGSSGLREWISWTHRDPKMSYFLVAQGKTGYCQGDYGYTLATNWADRIIGVLTMHPDWLNPNLPRLSAEVTLDEYSDWALGHVYGVIVKDAMGKKVESYWDIIGEAHAQDVAKETFSEWNPKSKVPTEFEINIF